MPVVASFVLRGPADWRQLVALVQPLAGPMASRGTPLCIVVAEKAAARSIEAHKFMWAVLDEIARQVCIQGKWFSAEAFHQHLKELHLPAMSARGKSKWQVHADGSRSLALSTTDLDRHEFDAYLLAIQAHAASEWGVEFRDRDTEN